jgi:putative nucleotidyltransferase with HDIG domain
LNSLLLHRIGRIWRSLMNTKKISVTELKPGMYVADLDAAWMDHPFLRGHFMINEEQTIQKIVASGIREVYIDPTKGLNVDEAPTANEVQRECEAKMLRVVAKDGAQNQVPLAQEIGRAQKVQIEANTIIHEIMNDVRLGRQVQIAAVEPIVERIAESILRNSDALLALCRVKDKDNYTFQHSVAVCALLVAFCRSVGLDSLTIHLAGVGGLLHDIGKVRIPDHILNKPGQLTDAEFVTVKTHVAVGKAILESIPNISEISILVVHEHHERHDGSGYGQGFKGEEISKMGRMAAICDVYDAITSDRIYHKGLAPHIALRKIFEWSKFHFDPLLVEQFLLAIGIFPVGSLVKLESGRVGVVIEQTKGNLLRPRIRVFFDGTKQQYITPHEVDLSKPMSQVGGDRITGPATLNRPGFHEGSLG